MIDNSVLATALFDASVRFERVIWLPGALAASDAFADDFKEFCDDLDDEDRPVLDHLPELRGMEAPDPDEISHRLIRSHRLGFIVQAATPVMSRMRGSGFVFSWGHYGTRWLYADTIEEAAKLALAWAEECRAKEKAKA